MKTKNQLRLDIKTGEDIYFGLPEERKLPEVGDRCYVLIDTKYVECEVVKTTKCFFYAKAIEKEYQGMESLPPGIPNEKFRPKEF